MKTVLSLAVLLLACLAGIQGADLGDACDSNNPCSDTTTMECDATALKCLSKVDQACTDATTCVTGAKCESSLCACDTAYTKDDANKICTVQGTGKPGGDCGASDACDTGAACNGQTMCACNTDLILNTATAVCEAAAGGSCASGVTCVSGSTCQSNECKVNAGESCAGNLATECVSGSTCESDVCKVDAGGDCAGSLPCVNGQFCESDTCATIPTGKVGAECTVTSVAGDKGNCGDNANCPIATDGFCECNDGYSGSPGGDCSEENGAVGVVSSFLTVTLAAVFTSLVTRH